MKTRPLPDVLIAELLNDLPIRIHRGELRTAIHGCQVIRYHCKNEHVRKHITKAIFLTLINAKARAIQRVTEAYAILNANKKPLDIHTQN